MDCTRGLSLAFRGARQSVGEVPPKGGGGVESNKGGGGRELTCCSWMCSTCAGVGDDSWGPNVCYLDDGLSGFFFDRQMPQ